MSNSKFKPWILWFIVSIFYAYQYVLRVMPSIMLEDIMLKFNIEADSFGQFSGVYYIGYSLMHLPLGIMLDKYGPRKILTLCMLLCIAGSLPLVYSDMWIYPVIGRFFVGAGSSAAILGAFKIIRMSFEEKKFTRMLSLCVSVGLFGAIYGGSPLNYMCQNLGQVLVIQILSLIGIALAALTYIIVPEEKSQKSGKIMSDIIQVISNKRVLMICIFAGMMVGPMEGFADVWGSLFFKKIYHLDASIAASIPSTIFIGLCFGAPFLGLIAEKTSYIGTIIFSGIFMSATFFTLIFGKLDLSIITFSFFLVGVCSAYQIIAIYYASTLVSERVMGITNAMANMIIMSFGYAFHSIIGYVITSMGGVESSEAVIWGMTVIPAFLSVGTLGFVWISAFRG